MNLLKSSGSSTTTTQDVAGLLRPLLAAAKFEFPRLHQDNFHFHNNGAGRELLDTMSNLLKKHPSLVEPMENVGDSDRVLSAAVQLVGQRACTP
jgi:hypothetical protein